MGRIAVLDPETVNRVAAGEVVERPASVVKELVENALDAGATEVTVVVKGKELEAITVADNGCGIAEEDVLLAFERHATSKISSSADLEQVRTLGFRGEALPSIAAVARVSLKTKVAGALGGTLVEIEGGRVANFIAAGAPAGTTVTVRDLFYNTPARRKFLSAAKTESALIADTVARLALAQPGVSLRFLSGERELFRTPGTGLLPAVKAIYGEMLAETLIPVYAQAEGVRVEGFIGRPALARTTRRAQTLVINGRFVKHAGLTAAVYGAYGTLLPTGKHPFFVLHLTVEGGLVDVNVHPQKLAVRFSREKQVAGLVRGAVKAALFGGVNLIPGAGLAPAAPADERCLPDWGSVLRRFARREGPAGSTGWRPESAQGAFDESALFTKEAAPGYGAAFPRLQYLGSLHHTYLLASGPEGLYLVDQHAAHERVLFEEFKVDLAHGGVAGQLLVEPLPIAVDAADLPAVTEDLARYGFVVEPFGEGTYLLRAAPAGLAVDQARLLVADLMACLAAGDSVFREREALASMACHGAVKAGEHLAPAEAAALLERLGRCAEPFTCPHGRPTAVCISREELERRFGRR
jgi:DNA mismatch repair protein MutL